MADETERCPCGKPVYFYSSLMEHGYCCDNCYAKARGYTEGPAAQVGYQGHGVYAEEEI